MSDTARRANDTEDAERVGLFYSSPCGGGSCTPGHRSPYDHDDGGGCVAGTQDEAMDFRAALVREGWLDA